MKHEPASHIRISPEMHRLLAGMQKKDKETGRVSADAAIRWMWGRFTQLSQENKRLRERIDALENNSV